MALQASSDGDLYPPSGGYRRSTLPYTVWPSIRRRLLHRLFWREFLDHQMADQLLGGHVRVVGGDGPFVNGLLVPGARPFASFQAAIEAALAE